ncbi:MAG: endonuclease IV [Patescibacteria group bacterium]|nr:MAG: endonuclease IV [Patescibacteria group bacterium]
MNRRVGAHVSASGGLEKAIERAHAIGANCAQIFSGSPRVWKRTELQTIQTEKMFAKRKELNVEPIFTHSLYLVNLASENPELLRKSFDVLQYDLRFDSLIKGSGIVVHLGSHQGRGFDAVKEQVAQQIAKLLETTPEDSTFLIENSAGQNGKLCSDLSEISWLTDRVDELLSSSSHEESGSIPAIARLGWCLDTCHAHAAGYSLGESQGSLISKSAINEITKLGLWDSLKCIHVNDSKDSFDSGRDRHENLGEGNISKEDMEFFLNYGTVNKITLITEAPGFEGNGPDAPNIEYLRKLSHA